MKHFFHTLFLLSVLFTGVCATGRADDFTRSREILRLLQESKGDSLYLRADTLVRSKLSPQQLGALFPQLVSQLGALEKTGEWSQKTEAGYTVDAVTLTFERAAFRMTVTYDEEGRMAGLFFAPATQESEKSAAQTDTSSVFRERKVQVVNGNIVLPGIYCRPLRTSGPVPLVVLVHGSGPNDRDETIGPNKPFRELAHALAAQGVATLRYDKRTLVYGQRFEEVSGRADYDTETVDDAIAALRLGKTFGEVDPQRIFIVGHSLGGALAPRIAARSDVPVAGIVLWAAPARPFEESLREQLAYIGRVSGISEEIQAEQFRKFCESLPKGYLKAARKYKPVKTAAKLDLPILVVQGGNDYQVTKTDYALWQSGLKNHKAAGFVFIPSADHLMRPLPAMAKPEDYLSPGRLSPEFIEAIAGFTAGKK